MTNRTLTMAARLAAATALTGSLAACDGRFGGTEGDLFGPVTLDLSDQSKLTSTTPPAPPGNPVYLEGSKAENEAAYEQAYGAPLPDSGQTITKAPSPSYAPSVYEDGSTINQVPLNQGVGSATIVYSEPAPILQSEPVLQSVPAETVPYSVPLETIPLDDGASLAEPPGTLAFSDIVEGLFVDAAYQPGAGTPAEGAMSVPAVPIEGVETAYVVEDRSRSRSAQGQGIVPPTMAVPVPGTNTDAYGSTASARYAPTGGFRPAPIADTPSALQILPTETLEEPGVLSAGTPLPRARPDNLGVSDRRAALETPIPAARPKAAKPVAKARPNAAPAKPAKPKIVALTRSPMPVARPTNRVAVSGRAIADAPPLTEPPTMIEVEPIFADEQPAAAPETEIDVAEAKPIDIIPNRELLEAIEPDTDLDETPVVEEIAEETVETTEETVAEAEATVAEAEDTELAATAPEPAEPVADASEPAPSELSGTSWRLVELEGGSVDAAAELHFDGGSGYAGGQSFCNNYGGEFTEGADGTFKMANIFSTETRCPHFSLEKQYMAALETAQQFKMAPGLKELRLIGADGEPVAVFSAF